MLPALGSDGLFDSVPTLSPHAGLPPVRSQKLNAGNNDLPFIAQVVGHCQHSGQPLILNEMAPIRLDSRRRLPSGCSHTLSRNRTYEKMEGLTNPQRIPSSIHGPPAGNFQV